MNRILTAAVALAMGLGMAGLAQAQTSNYVTAGQVRPCRAGGIADPPAETVYIRASVQPLCEAVLRAAR